eukprot:320118_1
MERFIVIVLIVNLYLLCIVLCSVPTIEELSANWNEAVPLRAIGEVQNFVGSVGLRGSPYQGIRQSDLISMSQLTFAPFDGNMINSTIKIIANDTIIPLTINETKWSVYDVARRTSFFECNDIELRVTNHVRLGFEKDL